MSESNTNPASPYEGMLEQLYDLSRDELRSLAWEAMLISDGPDKVEGEANTVFDVTYHGNKVIDMFVVSCPKERT